MNIVIAVEPDQVDLALRSIAHIAETGLPEGSRLHVICEPESADALRPADNSHQLHVCEDQELRRRFGQISNFQFAYACMELADQPGVMLLMPAGIAPASADAIADLQSEYNNSSKTMAHANLNEEFPRPTGFAVYPENYWNRSNVVKYLWGHKTPNWPDKLCYEIGHDSYLSPILRERFLFVREDTFPPAPPPTPDLDEECTIALVETPAEEPKAKVVKAKKKHVRMKRRTPAVAKQ